MMPHKTNYHKTNTKTDTKTHCLPGFWKWKHLCSNNNIKADNFTTLAAPPIVRLLSILCFDRALHLDTLGCHGNLPFYWPISKQVTATLKRTFLEQKMLIHLKWNEACSEQAPSDNSDNHPLLRRVHYFGIEGSIVGTLDRLQQITVLLLWPSCWSYIPATCKTSEETCKGMCILLTFIHSWLKG